MAATRKSAKRTAGKSAKRTAGKKRSSAKRGSTKKSAGKAAAKRRTKGISQKAGSVKKKARKVVRAARGPINTVLGAGGKTWKALKSTTAQVVEGVKGTFGVDESSSR
jgi:hypothetical protein